MKKGYLPASAESRYSVVRWRFFLADTAFSALLLVVFQLLLSGPVASFAEGLGFSFYAACFVYGSVFLAFLYAVSFPLEFAGSFIVEHRFKLSDQRLGAWLIDEAKSAVLTYLLWMACMEVFYLLVRNFPTGWWFLTALAWIAFSVILTRLMPVLLIPLFFRYFPIEDEAMKERIMRLAEKCRIRLLDVCQIDLSRKTKKANAALVGLGDTRRVIMADTLMKGFTPDEAETVVAHEFGHFRFRHIWKLLAFSAILTTAGFFLLYMLSRKAAEILGASGPADIRLLPALIFIISAFGLIALPFSNWFSRMLEREADRYAVEMAGSPEVFISVMRKLASMNQADTDPPLARKIFIYNHPPIGERIRMAEGMMRAQRTEVK